MTQTINKSIVQGETPTRPLASPRLWTSIGSMPLLEIFPQAEADPDAFFEYERAMFTAILPLLSRQYAGQFVAVHGGSVVDSDRSRAALVRRFFERFGDTHVYIGFAGPAPIIHQVSPFRT